MFSQGHINNKVEQNFNLNVSASKGHLLSRGKCPFVCEVTVVFSTSVLYVLCRKSDINSSNARKTFLPLLKIVYKLPSLFMNLFFCFILSAWSCLASFCSHWAIIDGASFLLFLGMLFCEACSIAPAVSVAHGPPAAFDSFAVAGILWGTLPQLVLLAEWLCTIVGAAHTHTHARRMVHIQEWDSSERPLCQDLKWVFPSLFLPPSHFLSKILLSSPAKWLHLKDYQLYDFAF